MAPIFAEYIGARMRNVKLSDVPILRPWVVPVHLILSFAIDYTNSTPASPTNGLFHVYWDKVNITPKAVEEFKAAHRHVKVALSLGGDSVLGNDRVYFRPSLPISSWIENAVKSLTAIITEYHLDGIDINYEHFKPTDDTDVFADCIGQLLMKLKEGQVISFASIAPFNDDSVQANYQALWRKYGSKVIDYVNFQFYTYPKNTTVEQFMCYFDIQNRKYPGGNMLASFISDGSGGLSPDHGFFEACRKLKEQQKLGGIFVWCADTSKEIGTGFVNEKKAQKLLDPPSGCFNATTSAMLI